MKKTDIENEVFRSVHFLGIKDLNQHYAPNNNMIKAIMGHMCEEFKAFLDKEYDLNKRYFKEGLYIHNTIRFIPETEFSNRGQLGEINEVS